MSGSATVISDEEALHLSAETHEALVESAQNQGRTVHEEAERIIRTHLASLDEVDE
jgi:hypothetical protein